MTTKAVLALENGDLFEGVSIGAPGESVGEVVFNTAITGYQEILSDPSYARQIITLTHPHIGNTGVNDEDDESPTIWSSGLIVKDVPNMASSWRKQSTLHDYLMKHNLQGLAGIDTRKLTRILRDQGSQNGCLLTGKEGEELDTAYAFQQAKNFPGLEGMDLAKEVTVKTPYQWSEGTWQLGRGFAAQNNHRFKVVAYDFGVKKNILRMLSDRECLLTVVPAQTSAKEVLALKPDGIFLSNGPGDPDPCDYAITAIRELIKSSVPIFGICLGLQLLGLAAGIKSRKMSHGHHGANHPVKNLEDETVLITSQNHGFCLDDKSLPDNVKVTHRSLFDNSLQGIRLVDKPAFGFQGHPEASPGPHDAAPLFDHFIELMEAHAKA